MGLRSRLLKKLKRTLTSEESAEQPAAPSAPKVFEPPPGTMPPMEDVAAAAPAAEEPATAVETPATAVETPATAVSEQPAAASPPPEPAPEVAVAPIAPPPQPGDLPVRIRNRDDGEESWASDYSTDDAPVRNAHYRPVFESSHRSFRVRVINEDTDLDVILDCEPGEFVLDAADRAGQELPFSCRSGGCLSCSAKVLSGDVEMGEQYVLEDEHVANHFVLLCCSSPLSDIVVRSHQEDNIQ
ncbi:MAG: 2Fe-2S iron-sulfur cluster-binding protein [Myxococcota bacterium]|nr:2Fe-2S iron-sulfur cluster-binding protein [Myxococcota bacterium]